MFEDVELGVHAGFESASVSGLSFGGWGVRGSFGGRAFEWLRIWSGWLGLVRIGWLCLAALVVVDDREGGAFELFGGWGWVECRWAVWSEVVGFVQLWLGLGGIGEGFGSWGVDELVVGEVEGFGLGVGEGAGFGGGAELAEDQAVFAQGGGDGAVVDLVEAGDLGGGGAFDERCDSAAVGDEGEGLRGVWWGLPAGGGGRGGGAG